MKFVLVIMITVSLSFAGITIYGDVDLAGQWQASVSGVSVGINQGGGLGLGLEHTKDSTPGDPSSSVFGGRFQLDRALTGGATYHFHTIYGQYLYSINDKLALGGEINYSIHGGNSTYASGATLGGTIGYAVVAQYSMSTLTVKGGYRVANGTANSGSTSMAVNSSGLFLQFGIPL